MAPNVAINQHRSEVVVDIGKSCCIINKTIKRYSFGGYYFVAVS